METTKNSLNRLYIRITEKMEKDKSGNKIMLSQQENESLEELQKGLAKWIQKFDELAQWESTQNEEQKPVKSVDKFVSKKKNF